MDTSEQTTVAPESTTPEPTSTTTVQTTEDHNTAITTDADNLHSINESAGVSDGIEDDEDDGVINLSVGDILTEDDVRAIQLLAGYAAVGITATSTLSRKLGNFLQAHDVPQEIVAQAKAQIPFEAGTEFGIVCECIANESPIATTPAQLAEIVLTRIAP